MKLSFHAVLRAIAVVCALVSTHAHAQGEVSPLDEYNKRLKMYQTISPGGETPFGEQINLYSGELSFQQTDITFEGTGPLISISRSTGTSMEDRSTDVLAFGEWDSSIPRMETLTYELDNWPGTGSCTSVSGGFTGLTMVTDDGQRRPVLERAPEYTAKPTMTWTPPGQTTPVPVVFSALTNDNWQLGCLPGGATNGGEAFVAISPAGTKYFFTHIVYTQADTLLERDNGGTIRTDRKFASLFATRIEDRFGNSVTFKFNAANPRQLDEISGSDGRKLTFAWRTDVPVISAITKHGETGVTRTWQYQYAINGTRAHLTAVVLPDNSSWQYSANVGTLYRLTSTLLQAVGSSCSLRDAATLPGTGPYSLTVTSPSGASGTFELTGVWHGRSYVPSGCPEAYEGMPSMFGAVALTKRTISGPGVTPQVWTYAYSPGQSSALRDACAQAETCPETAWTQVVDPDGDLTRHTYSTRYGISEGRSLKVETYDGTSTLLRTESYSYASPTQGPWPTRIGISLDEETTSTAKQEQWAPMAIRTTVQQGRTFRWQATAFDGFARAIVEEKTSTLGYSKTDTTDYQDLLPKWILGQVTRTYTYDDTTGPIVSSTTSFDANGMPLEVRAFGKLKQTLTYHPDGNVATVADGRNTPSLNTTVSFSNWKRGIPETIAFPDGYAKSAEVDDLGQISYVEDELGNRTCYDFDVMGRLQQIVYPSDTQLHVCDRNVQTNRWNPLVRSFSPKTANDPDYGLGASHWVERVNTGNGYTVTHYDALWRPVVAERFDNTNATTKTATLSQTVTRYDGAGQVAYQSYPTTGVNSYTTTAPGTRTFYDALGRPVRVEQDSELGVLATTTEYIAGFQTKVTRPDLQVTTTSYQAYDQPSTDWVRGVALPEGVYSDIPRDFFGKPQYITRRNQDWSIAEVRTYTYNGAQELCRTVEPETGATLTGYDEAGNLAWSASGLAASTPCDDMSATTLDRMSTRRYDNRNRLVELTFADDLGEQLWAYTPDGLPSNAWTYNGIGRTTLVYNAWSYNSRRLLGGAGETLHEPGWTWALGYGYDRNGFMTVQYNPDTSSHLFAVNALGQITGITGTAGTYVSNASYFPNGALKSFTYGNGIVHTLEQNTRGMPYRSKDAYGTFAFLDDGYNYDSNGNVMGISDGATGQNQRGNRTMRYDGLDRLVAVSSPMFYAASIQYDVLDNLQHLVIGGNYGRDHYYCYDAANQLTNIKPGDCNTTPTLIGLGYDEQGNLENKNGQHYVFSQDNRLREVVGKEKYHYDARGMRSTQEHATLGNIRSFYNKAGQLAFQSDARRQKTFANVYLAGSLVATREQSLVTQVAAVSFHHTDSLGTPVVVTNAARGVVERSEYEPYGKLLNRPIHDGPGYTGHVEDAQSGLTYMQQRYYDPTLGRFLSVDPVTAFSGPGANFNRYWYASNNPYTFTDPDGRQQACSDVCMRLRASSDGMAGSGINNSGVGTKGIARALTTGEIVEVGAKGYIDSQAALGPGGKKAVHFFADDAIEGVGNLIDGEFRDAAVNAAMAFIGKKLKLLKAAPERMAIDMRKIMVSLSGGRSSGAARDFHDASHIADRTANELATDFMDVARTHGIPDDKIPVWIRNLADD